MPTVFVHPSDKLHLTVEEIRSLRHDLRSALVNTKALEHLRQNFDNAWLAGAHSIILPSDPSQRYPLWTENALNLLEISETKQMMWVRSADWLYKVSLTTASSYALAEGCITNSCEVIPCDEPVPGPSPCVALRSLHLAKYASNEWVDDEIMNAELDFITRQLSEGSRTLVANCLLPPYLRIS